MSTSVYYDGDCPFCTNYVGFTRLKDAAGPVELIDLRQNAERRADFETRGLDPDNGMIVETGGQTYHGADAMNVLSLMSTGSGLMNALSAGIFRHKALARLLYPVLRAGRNATLMAMGTERMAPVDAASTATYLVFARFMGLFTILHGIYYSMRAPEIEISVTTFPLIALGIAMVLAPQLRALLVVTIATILIDSAMKAPVHSNHTMLLNALMVTFALGGFWHLMRGATWGEFFRDVRPVGRVLLLIMYTFGIFHKINSDFLNPISSCAVVLWRDMPPPLVWIDNAPMHYLAIYGTFVVEGIIMAMLILPRFRHWGIVCGIGFHSLLALSAYAMYPAFSTLAIVLHTLFISRASASAIVASPGWQAMNAILLRPAGIAYLLTGIALLSLFATQTEHHAFVAVWIALVAWPLWILASKGGADPSSDSEGPQFWSPLVWLNVISVLFFLNAAGPYLGLKTAQSMNMFANLRLEGGVSNHLVFPNPPGPFPYLDDVVTVTRAGDTTFDVDPTQTSGEAMVYYQFLTMLEASAPSLEVAYILNGVEQPVRTAGEILAEDRDMLHSPLVRRLFHFVPVVLDSPQGCRGRIGPEPE